MLDPSRLRLHERACFTPRTLERLFEIGEVTVGGPDECWIWTHGKANYGAVGRERATRVVLELVVLGRPLRPGWFALHHCDVSRCVNPAHLYEGTRLDNARDAVERGRMHVMTADERAMHSEMMRLKRADPEFQRRMRDAMTPEMYAQRKPLTDAQRQDRADRMRAWRADPANEARRLEGLRNRKDRRI